MNSQLSIPRGWEHPRSQSKFVGIAVLFFGAFAAFWVFQGIRAVAEDRIAYTLFYFPSGLGFMAVMFLSLLVIIQRHRDRPHHSSIIQDAGRTRFQTSSSFQFGYSIILALGTLGCAAFSIGLWSGALHFPLSPGQKISFPVVVIASGLYALRIGMSVLVGKLRFPRIDCTPDKLIVRGFKDTRSIEWKYVARIDATSSGKNAALAISLVDHAHADIQAHGRKAPRADRHNAQEAISATADLFAVGAVPLYWFLRYYLDNPEDRAELADERALTRLRGQTIHA